MRLTIIIILVAVFQLSAKNTRGQTLTYNKKEVSISKLFMEIKKQTGYNVVWSDRWLSPHMMVNVDFYNTPLAKVFDKILFGRSVTYEFVGKAVVIKIDHRSLIEQGIGVFAGIDVHGRVVGENNVPLEGATVKVKGTKTTVMTDKKGEFLLKGLDGDAVLVISFLGYESKEVKASKDLGNIRMVSSNDKLEEVQVFSTGYQNIPKERATGSFDVIDSALLDRKVGPNILDRIDGVASGVLFNKTKIPNTPDISIRGRSTINANAAPLIILDNFPYDGDINNINPQDVKSITVLKDAAAASIWGARAGNGVIVITTKKGNFNQKPLISFNTNLTLGEKPDVYYQEQLTNQEYIDIEQFLFDKGKYNSTIDNGYGALSPAVEVMLKRRKGLIDDAEKKRLLDGIADHDNRKDLDQYFNRNSLAQQYQLSASGGGNYNKYFVSMGYDKNLPNSVINSSDRLTLNLNNTILLLNNKLELSTGILFSSSTNKTNGSPYTPSYPYERVADDAGVSLPIVKNLRLPYIDTAGNGLLLDWHYRPLDELNENFSKSKSQITDYRINLQTSYSILNNLKATIFYTYNKGSNTGEGVNSQLSFSTRDLINQYSEINTTTRVVTRNFPLGDINTISNTTYYSHYARGQLSYENTISSKHEVNVIAGYEIKDFQSASGLYQLIGYNPSTATNANLTVNPLKDYKYYYNSGTAKISLGSLNFYSTDRYRSYYVNGAYVYDKRYVLSVSARKDESNLFGVKTNQKGVPLWSLGLAWNLSSESFYNLQAIPYLKLRATYGYNGNVDKSTSAYLTSEANPVNNRYKQPFLNIINPPNPSLEWEKVKNINLAADFGTRNNKILGSIEFWLKDGIDLIGKSPIAPQTGVSVFTGNSANMRSKGIDFSLQTKNINMAFFNWTTNFLFSYSTDKITNYKGTRGTNSEIISSNYLNPLEGYSYYSLFSYKWMGLDVVGNPQTMFNGNISQNYSAIAKSMNVEDLVYSGTVTPKYFGSLRNTINWKAFELSFNITYKFDYFFRRTSLNNGAIYGGDAGTGGYQQSDYNLRWQKNGDELTTSVPSLVYPVIPLRSSVYTYGDILIEKGDHIRLQDVRLNFLAINQKTSGLPFTNLNLYLYVSNLGIIWKATNKKLDPDFPNGIPSPRTYAIGLKANL